MLVRRQRRGLAMIELNHIGNKNNDDSFGLEYGCSDSVTEFNED